MWIKPNGKVLNELTIEKKALFAKLQQLKHFLETNVEAFEDGEHYMLLTVQSLYMEKLEKLLSKRIALLKKRIKEAKVQSKEEGNAS